MTHFLVGVIVPRDVWKRGERSVKNFIDGVMAPYAEEPEPDYMEWVVKYEAEDFVKEAKAIIDKLKKEKGDKELIVKYTKLFKEKKYTEIFDSWEGGELLDGDWGYYTNPNSFYDYYSIGGRWNGLVIDKPRDDNDGGFNYGDDFHNLKENSVDVKKWLAAYKKHPKKYLIYKIVSDDDLIEADDVGWWGSSKPKVSMAVYKKQYEKLLTKHKGDVLVSLDCHV